MKLPAPLLLMSAAFSQTLIYPTAHTSVPSAAVTSCGIARHIRGNTTPAALLTCARLPACAKSIDVPEYVLRQPCCCTVLLQQPEPLRTKSVRKTTRRMPVCVPAVCTHVLRVRPSPAHRPVVRLRVAALLMTRPGCPAAFHSGGCCGRAAWSTRPLVMARNGHDHSPAPVCVDRPVPPRRSEYVHQSAPARRLARPTRCASQTGSSSGSLIFHHARPAGIPVSRRQSRRDNRHDFQGFRRVTLHSASAVSACWRGFVMACRTLRDAVPATVLMPVQLHFAAVKDVVRLLVLSGENSCRRRRIAPLI
ncbi:hypothetical protein KCP74_25185 [Salmonella enterica subsp. enterica]|nr:hypothetical protein KCP74_25185 [Salmonella enterica subsp. enterica]